MPTFRFNRVFPVIPERDHPFNNVRNIFQKNYIISNSIIPNISNGVRNINFAENFA